MRPSRPIAFSRRLLLLASLLLGVFVLFDLGLFGWLIFRSLSQRQVDEILLATRQEAEGLAERIAGGLQEDGKDLFSAVASEKETLTYIDSMLQQRSVLQTLEIRAKDGRVVYRAEAEATFPEGDTTTPDLGRRELSPGLHTDTRERTSAYEVEVPIGDLGFLYMGLSRVELERRSAVLRQHLVRQTVGVAVVTCLLLLVAYLVIWRLWRRGRQLEAQAAEAERLAYVGTLASGLAHEIRNPLNSLNLNMQLLAEQSDVETSGSRERLLTITRSEIGRLERLVTDFLSYARPRSLELEEVTAVELMGGVVELMAPQIDAAGAEVVVDDRSTGARLRVDVEMMRQLLINLLQNALQATARAERPARVVLSALRRRERLDLEVADNGVGIPDVDRERMFDLFYSTRKGGTGLGLAVVDRIAGEHDGQLTVDSVVGEGTRVTVSLGRVEAGSAAAGWVLVDAAPRPPAQPSLPAPSLSASASKSSSVRN